MLWSEKTSFLLLILLSGLVLFTPWLVTLTARVRQVITSNQSSSTQQGQDQQEGQEMEVYAIPVVDDDIPTVHDINNWAYFSLW